MTKDKEDYMCPYEVTPFAIDLEPESSKKSVE